MSRSRATMLTVVATLLVTVASVPSARAARRRPTVEFRPVLTQLPSEAATGTAVSSDVTAAKATVASCDVGAVEALPVVPTPTRRAATPTECVVFPNWPGGRRAFRYYLGPARDLPIEDAKAQFLAGQGWTVKLQFTKAGAKKWDRLAGEQFHRQVAISYEGIVVSAPTIQPNDETFTSFGGAAVISGSFTQKEASALAGAAQLANGR